MADFTDILKLNDLEHGAIHQIVCDNQLVWRRPNQNLNRVPLSIDTDGSIYNGCGYIDDYRLSSSGELRYLSFSTASGFIPYKAGDVIRLYGVRWTPFHYNKGSVSYYSYISFYDESFNILGSVNLGNAGEGTSRGICGEVEENHTIIEDYKNCVTEFHIFFTDPSDVKYVRISGYGHGEKMVITINEPIIDKSLFTNQVPLSIDENNEIYNNNLGYKIGYRVRSGGAVIESNDSSHTGFIPVKMGDVIRIQGFDFSSVSYGENAINVSDKNFTNLGQFTTQPAYYGIFSDKYRDYGSSSLIQEPNNIHKWVVPPDPNIAYIRVCGHISTTHELIVTVNEEIKYGTGLEKPYTNVRSLAEDYVGNPYGLLGYKNGYRLNSGCTPVEANGMSSTGFIPCKMGDIVRLQGINFNKNSVNYGIHRIAFFNSNKVCIGIV